MQCFDVNETVSALVADTVLEHMEAGGTGEVLMVNSQGVYLSAGDQIWLLCDISWGIVPIGIAIDGFKDQITKLHIVEGQSFDFCENSLVFSGRTLEILPITFTKKENGVRSPQAHLINKAALDIVNLHKERGVSMLVLPIILHENSQAATTLNPYCARAYPLFSRLINALIYGLDEEIYDCVASLLGLGTGLTPSSDDVMLGMLYAFRKLGSGVPKSVDTFRTSIDEMCDTHTNKVSAAYLKAVLAGAYFERIERVWSGLCGEEPLDTSILFKVGGSSGTEMLLGALIALYICGYIK